MRLSLPPLDTYSFWLGFLAASLFWWVVARLRPVLKEMRAEYKQRRENVRARGATNLEDSHRKNVHRRAQGMHLAAPLFSLDEVLIPPLVLAPPVPVEPGGALIHEDLVGLTLPYLPEWPEIGAIYGAPSITLGEALTNGVPLALIGQPGAGKTVALAHLASLAANSDERLGKNRDLLPFLVHVADLSLPVAEGKDPLTPLIDHLSEHVGMLELSRLPIFVQQSFRSGRVLLLIDGLDELPPDLLTQVSTFIGQVLQAHPKTQVVVSASPEMLDGLVALGFAPLALRPWHIAQQTQFAENWGRVWEKYIAVEAWAQSGPGAVDPLLLQSWLAGESAILTPLEFTLKVWGAYAGDGRGPLPAESIEAHLRRLTPLNVPVAALEMLAMQVSLSAQPIFDPRKAREWVRTFEPPEEKQKEEEAARKKSKGQPAPTPGLLYRLVESGLLVAYSANRMRFVHPVLCGYLAGRALVAYEATQSLIEQPNWNGRTLAMRYLAAFGDATPLAEALLAQSDVPLERPLFTVARWLRDGTREAAWRGKALARLAKLMQTEGLPLGLRGQAMAALVLSADPGATTLFRQFLQSHADDLLTLSALGAGATQDLRAIEHLASLFSLPNLGPRRAACLALVAIGTTPALEIVARALLQGDEELRRASAEALANHPAEGYAMLRDGVTMEDLLVRRAVVYGLGRVREDWATELLQKAQVQDSQWVVRNTATELMDNRQHAELRAPRGKPSPPAETPWLVSFAGQQGQGIAPGSSATDILLLALKNGNEEERLGSLQYLVRSPSDGVIAGLYQAMYGGDRALREAAYHTVWLLAICGISLPHPSQFGLG